MSVPVCDCSSGPGQLASTSVGITHAQENTQRNPLVGELQENFIFLSYLLFSLGEKSVLLKKGKKF